MPSAAALSTARSPHPRLPRVPEMATVNPGALSPGPSTPSAELVSTRLFISQSHPTPVRTGIYEREKYGVIHHRALSEATTSARTLYWVRPLHFHSLSEAESAESRMREIRSPCSAPSHRAPETVLDLAKMSLGWLRELLGQKRASQEHHAVPKLKLGKVI